MANTALGVDVGGANIKAAVVELDGGSPRLLGVLRDYHPLWIRGRGSLESKLLEVKSRLKPKPGYKVAVCMTAELCDVYRVKSEGVKHIASVSRRVFSDASKLYFVTINSRLASYEEVMENPLKAAAANWAASAWLLEYKAGDWGLRNAVFIDIGSTTTTIIPIVNGRVSVKGYSDPEKLVYGELVYTGALRTNVSCIVSRAPYKGLMARVSPEYFSCTGDVHLILGYIRPSDYKVDAPDGRGVSRREAIERLARIVCSDAELMNEYEVVELARYIYEKQVQLVTEALIQVRSRVASEGVNPSSMTALVAGVGEHLAREAAFRAGFKMVRSISEFLGEEVSSVLPAYAAAIMALVVGG